MSKSDRRSLNPSKNSYRCSAPGLAVGAAVAGAVSMSDIENEWIVELSDSVKDDLNARSGAVSQSVREASVTLKAEIDDVGAESVARCPMLSNVDAALRGHTRSFVARFPENAHVRANRF